mgnify:CR=1 FL=1
MFQRLLTIAGETDCPLVMCDARTVYADGRSEPDTITQLKSSCVLNSGDMSPELLLELAGSVWRCLYHAGCFAGTPSNSRVESSFRRTAHSTF